MYSFFNIDRRWDWVVNAMSRLLYLREGSGTSFIGGWVGVRAGLDARGKFSPPPGFDSRTVQPVDVAIQAELFRPTIETQTTLLSRSENLTPGKRRNKA